MSTLVKVGPGSQPISQGNLQNKGNLGLSKQDEKIFTLVVGQIIPAIATGALIACIVFSFTVNPLFAIGAVAAFVIGFLGVAATYTDESEESAAPVMRVAVPPPPFEPNQPVGISNGGNNCWANAALQLVLNNPELEAACRVDPVFAEMFTRYRAAQGAQQYQCGYLGREARAVLHARNGDIDAGFRQEDASEFFGTMLGGNDERQAVRGQVFYRLQQSTAGRPFVDAYEPFIGLQMQDTVPFLDMFNSFFNYATAEGEPVRKVFPIAPQTLVIQLKRFEHYLNGDGSATPRKNARPLDIPLEMDVAAGISRDGVAAHYECTGFIVHRGEGVNGGHYISYVKREGKWWLCDDSTVREATPAQVAAAKRNSYMISYGKVQANPTT
ncbi:MAG: ubiquitin carboxyl-terminal hydrolase family protein [Chlamydiae bacterium]|nr:ubiquitin carboxyl-terminal hydrolase family protein [Chlamydiota bacterium]